MSQAFKRVEETELTDDVLVAAAATGDEGAFEQLFERHRRQVARVAGRFFAQREQIEEIIQDSFTKAYFALGSYHGTHAASFKAWCRSNANLNPPSPFNGQSARLRPARLPSIEALRNL